MCQQTNKKIQRIPLLNIDESIDKKVEESGTQSDLVIPTPYAFNSKSIIIGIVLVILSGLAGYIVSVTGISTLAIIELGASYFVVLGAAIIDYRLHIIPNYFPIILLVVRILCFVYEIIYTSQALEYLLSSLLGCFACFVLLMIAGKISKGGIGNGDIKLIAALGFVCGLLKVFASLLISLIMCLIISLLLVIIKKKTIKDHMSFGPYIYFGFLIVLIFNFS
jgi:leader peptidase (prepilin peptidase)/N-methyltransferase